jgi:hypothetical protein
MLTEVQSKFIVKDLPKPLKVTMSDHERPKARFNARSYTQLQTHKNIGNLTEKWTTHLIIHHLRVIIVCHQLVF